MEKDSDIRINRDIYTIGRDISIIHRYGKTHLMRSYRFQDMPISGMKYLGIICHEPGISQDGLVDFFKIDKGSVAKAVKTLEKDGYIRREENPEDKRQKMLYPTQKALEIHEHIQGGMGEYEKLLLDILTDEEAVQLRELLTKVVDNIVEKHDFGDGFADSVYHKERNAQRAARREEHEKRHREWHEKHKGGLK